MGAITAEGAARRLSQSPLPHFQTKVIDGLRQMVVFLDPHGKITWANEAACKKAGLFLDSLIGNPCCRVWGQQSQRCAACPLSEAMARGVEMKSRLDLGDEGQWESSLTPYFNEGGMLLGFAEVIAPYAPPLLDKFTHDLSFRALRCLCKSAQSIIAGENEAAIINQCCRIVVEEGGYHAAMIVYANQDQKRALSLMAFHGLDYFETNAIVKNLSWDDDKQSTSITAKAINSGGHQIVYDIAAMPNYQPWRDMLLKKGLRSCISLPLRDEAGRALGALTVFAREPYSFSSEEAAILQNLADNLSYGVRIIRARREKAMLLSAMGQIAEGLVYVDKDGVIGYVNKAAEEISQFDKEELLGCHYSIIYPKRPGQGLPESLKQALKEGRPWSGRLTTSRKNGQTIVVEANISPVTNEIDKDTHYFLVGKDVTAQIALEARLRQAQKMEAIGTLSRGIAHDFNNILAAIMGFTEASLGRLDDRQALANNLGEVVTACERAQILVRQILSFSKPSERNRAPMKIKAVTDEVLNMLRATLPATVEVQANTDIESRVMADSTELHQVLMNICANAGQAMPGGGVLRVSLSEQTVVDVEPLAGIHFTNARPGRFARIDIADTGHGMSQETMDRVFDPFFTTKQKAGGNGLGLSVAMGIVNSLGGAVTMRSKPGQGSVFSVFLPLTQEMPPEEKPYVVDQAPVGSETILLIDDEPQLVDATTMILEDLGYQVVGKTSPESALRDFNSSPELFDLVITDMTMPGMTGEELARNFLNARPRLPVIILSGYHKRGPSPFGNLANLTYLDKPIRRLDLAQAIRRALSRADENLRAR
ncbi:PAS domain-containing protein [Desulfarculus baarsii]